MSTTLPAPPRTSTPARGGRRLRRTVAGLLGVVAVVALAAGALTLLSGRGTGTGPGASVAVIGDSYSTGTVLGGLGPANWTARLGVDRDWRITDTAVGGTGYVASHGGTGAFEAAQLDRAVTAGPDGTAPDVVVVQGSINDGLTDPGRVRAAAAALYAAIHERAPAARLVVVGPPWPDGTPTREILALRDAVHGAATAAGAVWIDPIAEHWFADPALIGADGVHPTDSGHALIAARVGQDLRCDGV